MNLHFFFFSNFSKEKDGKSKCRRNIWFTVFIFCFLKKNKKKHQAEIFFKINHVYPDKQVITLKHLKKQCKNIHYSRQTVKHRLLQGKIFTKVLLYLFARIHREIHTVL